MTSYNASFQPYSSTVDGHPTDPSPTDSPRHSSGLPADSTYSSHSTPTSAFPAPAPAFAPIDPSTIPDSWVHLRLIDAEIVVPRNLFKGVQGFPSLSAISQDDAPSHSSSPVFVDLSKSQMDLLLHWFRYKKVPIVGPRDIDELTCIAIDRNLEDLARAILSSKDKRAMSSADRSRFDQNMLKDMDMSLATITLWPDPARVGFGEGTAAANLGRVTYKAFVAALDANFWDLPLGAKKLVSLEFRFPLSMTRPFSISTIGSDIAREQQGQPGFDSTPGPSTGRQAVWNTYRADPSRQIFHRVFFDSIVKRIYSDGFDVKKEWFDVVGGRVFYLVSH